MTAHFVNLLDDLRRNSLRMASQVEDMVQEACEAVFAADAPLAQRVIERDGEVDAAEIAVETEVIRLLALYQPVGIDLRTLCTVLKVNNDLERVADCAVNIAERARHGELQILAQQSPELKQMCPVVRQVLRGACQAYAASDPAGAHGLKAQEQAIDALYRQIVRSVVQHSESVGSELAGYLDLLSVAKNLERISDHAINIAEDVIYAATGRIVRHGRET